MKPIEMLGCSVTTMVRMITKCYIRKLWFVRCKVHISFCALMTVFVFTVN